MCTLGFVNLEAVAACIIQSHNPLRRLGEMPPGCHIVLCSCMLCCMQLLKRQNRERYICPCQCVYGTRPFAHPDVQPSACCVNSYVGWLNCKLLYYYYVVRYPMPCKAQQNEQQHDRCVSSNMNSNMNSNMKSNVHSTMISNITGA